MRGLIDRYVAEVLKPSLDVPLGGMQDEAVPMSFHCAKSYQSVLNRWVLLRWETYAVAEFERAEVRAAAEQWLRSLWRSSRNPQGLAPKMVRSISNVMRQVFKHAVKWGYLQQNPMADKRIELPRGSTKRLKKPQQLTAAQFFYLLSLLGPREKVAVCFAGWLGPRVSEAFGLQWGDLDLDEGVVTFRRGFVQGRITPLKTEASRTSMALPDDVREALRSWRALTPFAGDEDWTFASPHTKGRRPYWPGQLWKSHIKPILEAAGLPNIGWHGFRHSVTAWGKVAGLELQEVKALLRHENILTTSNIYGDVELESKREIQRRLVSFVREQAQLQAKTAGGERYATILQLQE